jgi:hypothetical protein
MADEKGYAYGVDINDIFEKDKDALIRGKNMMKKHNYYPFRSQFSSSNGIFFSFEDLKQ